MYRRPHLRNFRNEKEGLMKIINLGPRKFIFALALVLVFCWTLAGDASEQLEAMASASVNLRKNPSLSGEILSIVSKGRKVKILQNQGLWSLVDVEGVINGRGWVYAGYLTRILPKTPQTASSSHKARVPIASAKQLQGNLAAQLLPEARTKGEAVASSQTARVRISSVEQKQEILPAQLPPESRTEAEVESPSGAPLREKTSIAGVRENSLAGKELRKTKKETGALPKLEIPMAQEPAHSGPDQVPLEVRSEDSKAKPLNATVPVKVYQVEVSERGSMGNQLRETKNESNAPAQAEISGAVEPVPMPLLQPPHSDLKQDALGAGRKNSSGKIEQGDSTTYHKRLPGENKKHGNPGTPSVVSEQSVSDAAAAVVSSEFVIRSTGFRETQGLINKRESIEPVTIALKLLSIVMSCLVILLLYKKIDVKL
jgi:uncharacterized protein YgiM (DUF1202 family)